MVSHCTDVGFGDQFGQGQTKRYVHRQRERVLHDQQLEVETAHKRREMSFEMLLQLLDLVRCLLRPSKVVEQIHVQRADFRMVKVRFRDDVGALGCPVRFPGEAEALQAELGQHFDPLGGLERNAIRSCQARGHEADLHARSLLSRVCRGSPGRSHWGAVHVGGEVRVSSGSPGPNCSAAQGRALAHKAGLLRLLILNHTPARSNLPPRPAPSQHGDERGKITGVHERLQ